MGLRLAGIVWVIMNLGCGVKGDPQPPIEAPHLGRGRPTYDKASKELLEKEKNRIELENANSKKPNR